MKKTMVVLLAGLFLAAALFPTGAVAGPKEDTMALSKKGAEFVKQNGIEKAVEAFKTGDFQKGDLYLFAYDYKGNCIAQAVKPELIGKNLWNLKTPTGKFLIREQIDTAKKGGGWLEYEWTHEVKKVLMMKESYIVPIQGMEAYVGCGFYKE